MNTTAPLSQADQEPVPAPAEEAPGRRTRPPVPPSKRRARLFLGGLVCAFTGAGVLAGVQFITAEPEAPPRAMPVQSVIAPIEKPADPALVEPEPAATREDGSPMPKAGDVLEADPGLLTDGLRAIGLDDGTWQVIDPFQELPTVVHDDIARVAAGANALDNMQQATEAREDVDAWVHGQTGLHPVLIIPWTVDGEQSWAFWARDDVASFLGEPGTKDDVIADAQEWIDKHANPFPFTIIVTE